MGNSFVGKTIERKERHKSTIFTSDDKKIETCFRNKYFDNLTETDSGSCEIQMRKKQIDINQPYQIGIAVYQISKLLMLKLYYDFLNKYISKEDFE